MLPLVPPCSVMSGSVNDNRNMNVKRLGRINLRRFHGHIIPSVPNAHQVYDRSYGGMKLHIEGFEKSFENKPAIASLISNIRLKASKGDRRTPTSIRDNDN